MYEKDFPIYTLEEIKHNKHWISYYGYGGLSPYYAESSDGLTIPNCVPMVYGYWHCMGDCKEPKELKLCPGNACYFYPYNQWLLDHVHHFLIYYFYIRQVKSG